MTDKRDKNFQTFKEIKANGLAFAELGKVGYKLELSQPLFESNELEENSEAIMTIQYWLDQVFPNEKDENGNIIKWLTPWCYEIRMDWSQYPNENRLATKVYDDRFINSWAIDDNTNELVANGIQVSREKSRAVDCKNSNKYNITQDIAKAFEVFCDYEYKTAANGQFIKEYTDENGLVWTGRKVIFYNSAININNPLHLNYQKNLQTIERTAESSELYTKLFVTPSESSIMKSGYITIADTFANPTLDDFILNFDYLYSVGSISDYQMQFVKNYEVEVRRINSHLMAKSPVIDDLVVEINDREAEIAGYDKQIASAREQYTYYEKLKNNQVTNNLVVKNEANPYSTIFVPEGTVYRAALKLEGIIASSIKGYINKYSEPLFENADLKLIKSVDEIDDSKNYFLLLDEHDFPSAIYSIIAPSDVVLYLDLEYSPRNKYENICASFLNEIDNYEKQKMTVKEIMVKLESQLEKAQKEYNDKLKEKEELNRKLERIMGPALREGYWTPDKYDDIGQAHIKECSFNNGIEFTTSLFENEQLSYVDIGKDRIYYPYINIDNQLKNKWMGHDLNNLILHLQRDFTFTATEQATLDIGNYYFLYNSRQYYFKLDNKLVAGDSLTIKVEGATINLILNNSSPIELVSFLEDAINVTQRFEDSMVTLGDYLLYNNAGFIFSFKRNENNELTPILLLNNDKLFSEYRKYNRLAYSFQGETVVTLIEGIIQDYPNTAYSIYFPRILLAEDNVVYTSDTLTITVGKDENATELKKYYDYSVLLHEGKTCITLKLTGNNPFYNLVDASIIYNVNYRVSQANEALYIDAKQVAKDNSKPKFSYDISVALISSWEDNQIEKMPLIELGQLAYISDPILGVHAATGYVSEITYKLDKPQEDEIKIQNYKTKFEDLFETITASSEAMKNNQTAYDIAAGNFSPDGSISGDVIQTAINNNDFFFNYSATGIDINPTEGIILTNKKPYANGVYGQVVLQGGGIFLSDSVTNTGERIWNNGITPKGINASLITSGQINTNVIKVFAGDDMAFQWNSEGIYAYKSDESGRLNPNIFVQYSQSGLHLTDDTLEAWDEEDKVRNHQSLVTLDWNGLALRNHSGQKTLTADLDGNLIIRGTLKSYDYREGESRLLSTGWKIEPTGYAEFNDLFVRGTISASVFEYEETSAVGGRLLVSPTFILKSEHTNKANIQMAADTPLKIIVPIGVSIENNSFVAGGRTWKLDDVVIFNGKFINKNAFPLIKLGKNINDYPIYETKQLYMVISNLNPTNNTITLTSIAMVDGLTQNLFYGADGNIADTNTAITAMGGLENITGTGDWHLISFGTDGAKEGILLTAIEPNSGSYIDILGKGKDNLTGSTRVRLGDLSGLAANQELVEALGSTPSGWGLYADNVFLRGAIYATSGRIGSLSIDEVEEIPETIGGVSDTINEITTTKNGKVIINKGAITADSIETGLITTSHLASEVGEKLVLSSNESIQLIVKDVQSDYNSKFEVTNNKISSEVVELNKEITSTKSLITQTASEIRAEVSDEIEGVNSKITQTANSFSSEINRVEEENDKAIAETKTLIQQTEEDISLKVSTLNTKLTNDYYTKTEIESKVEILEDSILLEVGKTYVDQSALDKKLGDYSTKEETSTAIELSKEGILQAVSNTYTTKNDLNDTLKEYYTIEKTEAAIKTSSDGILQTVSNTYATIDSLGNYATKDWTISSIDQSASSITAKVESGDIASGRVETSKVTIDTNGISLSTTGTFTAAAGNFNITDTGDVSLIGSITAESGFIGGWEIGETSLFSGNNSNSVHLSSSNAAFTGTVGNCVFEYGYSLTEDTLPEEHTYSETPLAYNDELYNNEALWIWTRRIITYTDTDGSIKTEEPELLYAYPAKDNTYRISSEGILIQYIATKNTSTPSSSSSWQTTPAATDFNSTNKYLWQKVTYNLVNSDNEIKSTYTVDPVIISSYETNTYAIWAGGTTGQSAPFAVTKDGKLYATKLIIRTLKSGSTSQYEEKDIGSYPLWAIWSAYRGAVNNLSVEGDTLTISTYGGKSVTFKKAAVEVGSVILAYNGRPSSVIATVKDVNGGQLYQNEVSDGGAFNNGLKNAYPVVRFENGMAYPYTTYVGVTQSEGTAVEIPNKITSISLSDQFQSIASKQVSFTVTAAGTNLASFSASRYVDASKIYDAGADSITVTGIEASGPVYGDKTVSVNMEATLSDGRKAIFSSSNIDCTKIYQNGENSVTIPAANITRAAADSYSDSSHNTTIYVKAAASNGATGSTSFVVSGSYAYAAGRLTEAETLTLSPSSETTLGYGESVTVKATTTNNSTGKSVTITAKSDAEAYAAGYNAGLKDGKAAMGLSRSDNTITVVEGGAKTITASLNDTHYVIKGSATTLIPGKVFTGSAGNYYYDGNIGLGGSASISWT